MMEASDGIGYSKAEGMLVIDYAEVCWIRIGKNETQWFTQ